MGALGRQTDASADGCRRSFEFSSILCSRASTWALEWMQMRAFGLNECATYRRLLHLFVMGFDCVWLGGGTVVSLMDCFGRLLVGLFGDGVHDVWKMDIWDLYQSVNTVTRL